MLKQQPQPVETPPGPVSTSLTNLATYPTPIATTLCHTTASNTSGITSNTNNHNSSHITTYPMSPRHVETYATSREAIQPLQQQHFQTQHANLNSIITCGIHLYSTTTTSSPVGLVIRMLTTIPNNKTIN